MVDGYNTDDFYHLNFGWGGSYNGWYLLPDEIPYGLTVIEGAITDIGFPPINTRVGPSSNDWYLDVSLYPNPSCNKVHISVTLDKPSETGIDVLTNSGKKLYSFFTGHLSKGKHTFSVDLNQIPGISPGFYICRLRAGQTNTCLKMIYK